MDQIFHTWIYVLRKSWSHDSISWKRRRILILWLIDSFICLGGFTGYSLKIWPPQCNVLISSNIECWNWGPFLSSSSFTVLSSVHLHTRLSAVFSVPRNVTTMINARANSYNNDTWGRRRINQTFVIIFWHKYINYFLFVSPYFFFSDS